MLQYICGFGIARNPQFDHITHMKSGQVVNGSGQISEPRRKARKASAHKIPGLTQIGDHFYWRPKQINGARGPRVALGTTDFDEAVRLALDKQREVQRQYQPGVYSFERKRFLEQREKEMGRKELSRWSYDSDVSVLRLFEEWVGPNAVVRMITAEKIEKWREHLLTQGKRTRSKRAGEWVRSEGRPMTKGSVLTYLARVSAFLRWLKEQGGLQRNPMEDVEMPESKVTKLDRFCTKAERNRLLQAAEPKVPFRYREDLHTVLMLGFHAGMRLNEMLEAKPDWLRFWQDAEQAWHGEIVVQQTATFTPKDKEARSIPMNRALLDFLLRHDWQGEYVIRPEVERGKDKYRWNPRAPFKKHVKKAGLSWVGVHTMRHTYATHLVMGGVPIATVARWLGDSIEVTFKTYAGYVPNRAHIDAGM